MRDGDGERDDVELADAVRAFGLLSTGFFTSGAGAGARSVDEDEEDESEEEDGDRFFTGSVLRAFSGLRLCLGEGERRRSRRSDVDFGLTLGFS